MVGFMDLLAAHYEEPDDTTTLLAVADWLEERNDPLASSYRLLAKREMLMPCGYETVKYLRARYQWDWKQKGSPEYDKRICLDVNRPAAGMRGRQGYMMFQIVCRPSPKGKLRIWCLPDLAVIREAAEITRNTIGVTSGVNGHLTRLEARAKAMVAYLKEPNAKQ